MWWRDVESYPMEVEVINSELEICFIYFSSLFFYLFLIKSLMTLSDKQFKHLFLILILRNISQGYMLSTLICFRTPTLIPVYAHKAASCTGDRNSVVYSRSVLSPGLIMLQNKVSCRRLCSNIYKMIDFWYKSLVNYYANNEMSRRHIIQPSKFKTKLSSARLSFILLQSIDRSRDVVGIWDSMVCQYGEKI